MKKSVQIKLKVDILKQASRYIIYSPALDLSTSGKSVREAKRHFGEAALLLVEELEEAGTLQDVLGELGWRHTQKQWMPPQIISQEAVGLRVPVVA